MKEKLAPKARRPFPLFVKENCVVKKGASREEFLAEMRRLSSLWHALPEKQRQNYRTQSAHEFAPQRNELAAHGILPRTSQSLLLPTAKRQRLGLGDQTETALKEAGSAIATVGPYELEPLAGPEGAAEKGSKVGQGSYGKVFKCKSETGRLLAVKVFTGNGSDDSAVRELAQHYKLQGELTQQDLLWFPAVVAADPAAEPCGWVAYEFAGQSLHSMLRAQGHVDDSIAWAVAAQLKHALIAVHSAGILHLDVKPSNVLWCSELRQLKLCDFGNAESRTCAVADLHFEHYCTPPYRPPELVGLSTSKDAQSVHQVLLPATDMWSYGCLLYELMAGRYLMAGLGNAKLLDSQTMKVWCQSWATLASSREPGAVSAAVRQLRARLLRARKLCPVILLACNPEPRRRRWASVGQLKEGLQTADKLR